MTLVLLRLKGLGKVSALI